MRVSRTQPATAAAQPEWLTGAAWIDEIAVPDSPSRVRVDSVHFAPGARTVWHCHPLGQVLHVTEGAGSFSAVAARLRPSAPVTACASPPAVARR